MSAELTAAEAATVERFEQAPDALVEDLRDEVAGAAVRALVSVSLLPEWMQIPALGRNMRPLGDLVADALMPLIAQREAAARADERERVARAIEAAFPLPDMDADAAPCSAGHDCHAAARYTTGYLAARIAQGGTQ